MLDFYEFLARGIIAARRGRTAEAVKYLGVAQQISPNNPRVWLWLASVAENNIQKQQCLQNALRLDSTQHMARILLEKLTGNCASPLRPSADFSVFTCSKCGGKQYFDPDRMGLVCHYCDQVDSLVPEDENKGDQNNAQAVDNWAAIESLSSCQACGAQLSIPADSASLTCPFCASEHIQTRQSGAELIRPERIGLFTIDADEAHSALSKWSGGKIPLKENSTSTLRPIYLPFWHFNIRIQIRCALTRRVEAEEFSNYDRVVHKESGWPNHQAWYERDFEDWVLYGGRSLTDVEIDNIAPFNFNVLVPFRPQMLTGWQAELYQISLTDAAVTAQKRMRDAALQSAARRMIFIEPSNLLGNDLTYIGLGNDLILLPVWIYRYTWKGQSERALVNGQSGEVQGKKPGRGLLEWFQ